jgi:hypothetical protein
VLAVCLGALACSLASGPALAQDCIGCHEKVTPGVVADWRLSAHRGADVGCDACHGSDHRGAQDAERAGRPTPDTCAACHADRAAQFRKGKHALAWTSMNAMPTIHWQPLAMTFGLKGCGGCHKIGVKTADDARMLARARQTHGNASCDACHTRHTFSRKEAAQPQACQTCHMGFDHPQWEMYSTSKHGVRALLRQNGTLPAETPAPTCQTCHMPEGNHEVRTAWGFLAVRLPLSDNEDWATDQASILQALGVLDLDRAPTGRLEAVKSADLARLTRDAWQAERDRMTKVCAACHAASFAASELARGDDMVREADHLMGEAIRIVAALYRDGILAKPVHYPQPFPDLLAFHDAPTPIEQRLFVMFLEHRMRAFQGTFHASPDYALWYGWSEMRRDLAEIKAMAADLRERKAARP